MVRMTKKCLHYAPCFFVLFFYGSVSFYFTYFLIPPHPPTRGATCGALSSLVRDQTHGPGNGSTES